ncbi:MAG: ATP-binding cassette domain-containing protein [Candidatus Delongbacteria bacterium]|nr:ATP-binding cassette domain-containing protein [Candidatus Delongbacteria bacterium]
MIRIENLSKDYGKFRAVNSISFEVNDGEILGFLGPNGAGKSTTLKVITSYLAPTEGNVYVNNLNVIDDSMEIRDMIGYLPELNPLYHEMNVFDFLKFVSVSRGFDTKRFKKRLGEVIELCGLKGVMHKDIRELSKGYKQRVGLAQAIFHDPKILILDEPTNGLDPNQIVEIRELIKNLGKEKTVIISSHILQEIQATADRMIIINEGNIVANGTIDELMADFQGKTRLTMEIADTTKDAINDLKKEFIELNITEIGMNKENVSATLEYPNHRDYRKDIFNYAVNNKWAILEMSRHKTSLEDVFRNLTVEGGKHE